MARQKNGRGDATPVKKVYDRLSDWGEEERENAKTFGERHTDDGLDKDLTGCAGIAADCFSSLLQLDQTRRLEGGAEEDRMRAGDSDVCQ